MAKTKAELDYQVVDGQAVALSIAFGDGQLGGSVVTGAFTTMGLVTNQSLGKGDTLRNRNVEIHSVVTDVNAQTNRVSATYSLTGGAAPQSVLLESTVPNEGDSDRFQVVVRFV